ncbi:MAG: glycosyltransferase family 4 protein [Bacteroidales bacterium]|jgi:Fuc2NAc and GlcNAc transferase|nr:glycosyltransferase family 4 protein [Bacteroidales bacterium]
MNQHKLFLAALLFLSYLLTWVTRIIALRRKIIDIPNDRSSHIDPTPRGGGIAVVVTWYAGVAFLYFCGLLESNLFFALLSGIILAIVSLLDDIISLKPFLRMIFQILTALLAFYFVGGMKPVVLFNDIALPAFVVYPIAIIGIVWFINLYNFLDGIDGYASIEAISLGVAFYLLTGNVLNAVIVASVMGFLIWNWPKAKIFMGDVGSTQLGFILVILGIYYHNEQQLSIMWWLVLTIPFWFDATLTLFRRWRNKEKLSQAHRKHIYQRLVQSGFSHLKVDCFLILINTILIISVFLLKDNENLQLPVLILSFGLFYAIAIYTDRRKPFPRD